MTIEDFKIGDEFTKTYQVDNEMVRKFAEISGDWNPVHHDAEFAKGTVFKRQIAHGMISVAQFSGIFGMDMPGLGAIWTQQNAKFLAPVYLDLPYTAKVVVEEVDPEKNTVVFETTCLDADGNLVLTGKGILKPLPLKVKQKMSFKVDAK